ncbi:MAG: DUF2007 domain-containing protein [Chloroflexi bacterium]|nr:DUF2007 domain-containing protein [Chloroflexota bacterium]
MDALKYEKIGEANSLAEAEVIKSFLEAEGIDAELVEDSVSHSYYTMPFAQVEIFVPKEMVKRANKLLASFEDIKPEEQDEEE